MTEKISSIYKITNLQNNYIYVGSTNQPLKERFRHHCKPSAQTFNPNSKFYQDIQQYGKENFEIELLDTCFERHRFIIEEYWYKKLYKSGALMYEIKMGNSLSENTKQRIARLRNARDYKYHTEEFKYHLSQSTSGELNGMYGRKDDKAVNGRMVLAYYDKEHTQIYKSFVSVKTALQFLGLKGHVGLMKACKDNKLYHGFYWVKEWVDR